MGKKGIDWQCLYLRIVVMSWEKRLGSQSGSQSQAMYEPKPFWHHVP